MRRLLDEQSKAESERDEQDRCEDGVLQGEDDGVHEEPVVDGLLIVVGEVPALVAAEQWPVGGGHPEDQQQREDEEHQHEHGRGVA